ncbi:hypothetical protein MINS_29530 [Mycolicibacterium insubricum]|nr:hypothetical protein MINS_29530 [Mycolicibacterium insubricum]
MLLAVGSVGAVVLAGCGGADQKGNDQNPGSSAAAATSAQPSPDRASADALPAGFPSAVPVIKGTITGKRPSGLQLEGTTDAWVLTVADAGPDAEARAQKLLIDAGFKQWSEGNPVSNCANGSSFDKSVGDATKSDAYTVTLCPTGVPAPNVFAGNGSDFEYVVSVMHLGGADSPALPSLNIPEPPDLGSPP